MTVAGAETTGRKSSLAVFGLFSAYLILVKLFIIFRPSLFRSAAQAAVFEWHFLAIWIALGFAGVWMAQRTGFPEPWQEGKKIQVVFLPLICGVLLGLLAILTDRLTGWTSYVASQMKLPSIHIDFPASALIYPGGAIIVNIFYRLFPIPILLWLIAYKLMGGRRIKTTYWILSLLLSLIEPLGDLNLVHYGIFTMLAVFTQDYALNLLEMAFFRKLGFLAAVLLRVFFYFVWHVSWGAVQSGAAVSAGF